MQRRLFQEMRLTALLTVLHVAGVAMFQEMNVLKLDIVAESLDKKYLLVGECKWTTKENSDRILSELNEKANKLPFARYHTLVPKLFLKNKPCWKPGNVIAAR